MKKAVIFYQSKTGTTKRYAEEIGRYLQDKDVSANCLSIDECRAESLENIDYVFLGCWTKGLMVIFQKPDDLWANFVNKLDLPEDSQIGLFATYKIRTGSMFRNMEKQLNGRNISSKVRIKSRSAELTDENRIVLDEFVRR